MNDIVKLTVAVEKNFSRQVVKSDKSHQARELQEDNIVSKDTRPCVISYIDIE